MAQSAQRISVATIRHLGKRGDLADSHERHGSTLLLPSRIGGLGRVLSAYLGIRPADSVCRRSGLARSKTRVTSNKIAACCCPMPRCQTRTMSFSFKSLMDSFPASTFGRSMIASNLTRIPGRDSARGRLSILTPRCNPVFASGVG